LNSTIQASAIDQAVQDYFVEGHALNMIKLVQEALNHQHKVNSLLIVDEGTIFPPMFELDL
jgi:hypothetical protein